MWKTFHLSDIDSHLLLKECMLLSHHCNALCEYISWIFHCNLGDARGFLRSLIQLSIYFVRVFIWYWELYPNMSGISSTALIHTCTHRLMGMISVVWAYLNQGKYGSRWFKLRDIFCEIAIPIRASLASFWNSTNSLYSLLFTIMRYSSFQAIKSQINHQ